MKSFKNVPLLCLCFVELEGEQPVVDPPGREEVLVGAGLPDFSPAHHDDPHPREAARRPTSGRPPPPPPPPRPWPFAAPPASTFSRMVPEKRNGSWRTREIVRRRPPRGGWGRGLPERRVPPRGVDT